MLILDLVDRHAIDGAGLMAAGEIDRRNGNNAGNFAFRYALTRQFFPEARPVTFADINALDTPFEVAVVACSNWIGLSPEHERTNQDRFDTLETTSLRIAPFGLGCQIPERTTFSQLGPWTRSFVHRLAEAAPSISVRDEQTAEVLAQAGCRHVIVTGCPSNFINPDPALGASMARKATVLLDQAPNWSDLATCLTEYSGGYHFSANLFNRQYELMRQHGATYVLQDYPLLPFLLGEAGHLPEEYSLKHFASMEREEVRLALYLRRGAMYFSSFDEWLLQMRRFDVCFGMRLHGNMAALQAGTPALVLTHDARTERLCQTMSLPHLQAVTWLDMADTGPAPLLTWMLPFLEAYDAQRRELAQRMRLHVEACGLPAVSALDGLCGS